MIRILQKFDYRSSNYHRPNQSWVCGWATEGKPCHIGPDNKGNCRATFECQPSKTNDRWQCTRSELVGGKCSDGPLPNGICCRSIQRCRPVLNWRARVRATRNLVLAVSVGLLLLVIAGPLMPVLINPGDITFQHVQKFVDEVILVSDAELVAATRVMYEHGFVCETSGCAGVAAAMAGKLVSKKGEEGVSCQGRIVCVVSG